jgi:signal transduction histidine kinase
MGLFFLTCTNGVFCGILLACSDILIFEIIGTYLFGTGTPNMTFQLQRRSAILNRLLDLSLALNTNLSVKRLLQEIMSAVCEIADCEAASILLYYPVKRELRFAASNTPGVEEKQLLRIAVPLESSIAGEIFLKNAPMIIQNAADDARIYRPVDQSIGFITQSLLGLPMHVKGESIGVLEALNKRGESGWTEDDLYHLTILSSHAAVAIQNARQTDELRRVNDQLSQLDKIKNDFIAIASHELRTPLGVILGYASFLAAESQGEASEHAEAVLNSALHLRNLIEDLTNLRYLQVGQGQIAREHVPLLGILENAITDVRTLAEAKRQAIALDPQNANTLIFVDRAKMLMAFINILNNAVKFTPERGQIMVRVLLTPNEVRVAFSDNGIGIPSEELTKIFDKFYQVADHMTRAHNGMGIGLAISKGMVELHDGRIWAESAGVGRGSIFYVALPINAV